MQRFWSNSFGDTVGDMEVETLVITLHHSRTELEAETPGDKLPDLKASNVAETLTDLKAASPVVTLAPTPYAGRDGGQDNSQSTERCEGPHSRPYAVRHTIRH